MRQNEYLWSKELRSCINPPPLLLEHGFYLLDLSSVVSLKGGLPQKLQSKFTLSGGTVQIHSLFRHGFIKKSKSRFNRLENRRILFSYDGFRKTDLGIDMIANAFRGLIQNTRLFSNFSSFIFSSNIHLSEKGRVHILAYPQR